MALVDNAIYVALLGALRKLPRQEGCQLFRAHLGHIVFLAARRSGCDCRGKDSRDKRDTKDAGDHRR